MRDAELTNWVIIAVSICSGAIVALAAAGRLRRNPIAGIRTRSVRHDARTWIAGHRAAVAPVTSGTLASAVLAALSIVAYHQHNEVGAALSILAGVLLIGSFGWGVVRANAAARIVRKKGP